MHRDRVQSASMPSLNEHNDLSMIDKWTETKFGDRNKE